MPLATILRRCAPLLLLGAAAPACAQSQVPSGGQLVLGTYYEVDAQTCRPLTAPRVRITAKPALGKAVVVRTQMPAKATARCPAMLVTIAQVLYQADKTGADAVAWQVRYQRRGPYTERFSAQVRVTPPAAR